MNGITELAKLFKDRDNGKAYAPIFGRITALPDVRISIQNDKIQLIENQLKYTMNIKKQVDDEYIYLNHTAVLLPYNNYQNYILIGVVTDD